MSAKRTFLFSGAIVALSLFLMSWGFQGHYKISSKSAMSFTPEMEQFLAWAVTLAEHASDADERKAYDPDEGPRHYIDIDNYPGFEIAGRIPQTYDSVVSLYGEVFVIEQGILPWATLRTYDSLVSCFRRYDWEKAVLFAADLGHYVADGHQPLHLTRNYDGQYTGNSGIHSRYETGMVNTFLNSVDYTGDAISYVEDVENYVFAYIYSNFRYADSIMIADDYAEAVAGNHSSYTYKQALWEKTGIYTTGFFHDASKSLAELIYSAWTDAGKPDMNSGSGMDEQIRKRDSFRLKARPNPFRETLTISVNLPVAGDICILVIDSRGMIAAKPLDEKREAGEIDIAVNLSRLLDGIYFISVNTGHEFRYQKIIKNSD